MKPNLKQEQGFTLIEVIIAVLVLTVGLLGLVSSAALVTRMIGRGHRSSVEVAFSQRRLEMLRSTACTSHRRRVDQPTTLCESPSPLSRGRAENDRPS